MTSANRVISAEEVSKHVSEGDCWIVVDGSVLDVSKFVKFHPGGRVVLMKHAGKDASDVFHLYHNESILRKYFPRFKIGVLAGSQSNSQKNVVVPYGDPLWQQRFNSPFYKKTHFNWRNKVRKFVETEVMPQLANINEKLEKPPADLMHKFAELGGLATCTGSPWPSKYTSAQPPADYDYFHELILYDELARCGSSAFVAGITNGPAIGLPVILNFGSEEMKRVVAPPVLAGDAFIALAVSEPQAGSDVAGLVTTAKRDASGKNFIVNGNKKWITNGTYADWFVTAVRTGPPGNGGLSFLLIPRDAPGFTVRKLNVRGAKFSGTAYLDFDNCIVPVKNLIGRENQGFKLTMYNFNHERFYLVAICTRLARVCVDECMKYAIRRKTFGKSLHQHQAIRMKIAHMAQQVESLQSWLDLVCYQMCTMTHAEANAKIGDVVSLLKSYASKVYEACARETTHIFGGNSMLVGGVGHIIEPAVSQVKGYAIPGGAEDILSDYAARAAFRVAVRQSKL